MIMEEYQLRHLSGVSSEGPYRVHERATLTGRKNVEPITLCIVGICREESPFPPQGFDFLPGVEEDWGAEISYLVYASNKNHVGDSIPKSETRRVYLSDVYSYRSSAVDVKAKLPLLERIKRLGQRLGLEHKVATA